MLNYIDNNGTVPIPRTAPQSAKGNLIDSGVNQLPSINPDNSEGKGGSNQTAFYYEVRKKNQPKAKSDPADFFAGLPQQDASELMTKTVVSFLPETLVSEAWIIFQKVSFRHIPVINHDRKVVGMVSYNRLMKKIYEVGLERVGDLTIRSIMETDVLVISPETPVRSIALNLFNKKVGSMPVTDSLGILQGIITRSDILKAFFMKNAAIDLHG